MPDKPQIPDTWSEVERWVWSRIYAGEAADLNEHARASGRTSLDLDPRKAEGWDDGRRLSVAFLQTILTETPFVEAIPFNGVKILGALINGDRQLDLAHARVKRLLWIENSRLLVDIECRDLRVDGEVSLESSYVKGTLTLYEARIDGNLAFAEIYCEGEVDLGSAKISATLDLNGCTINAKLNMNGVSVGRDMLMGEEASFEAVDLVGADIDGQLSMGNSRFLEKLDLNGVRVGQQLFLGENTTFNKVDLTSAKIGGQLFMIGSSFKSELEMQSIEVGKSLLARSLEVPSDHTVELQFAKIAGSLDLSGAKIAAIDLTGATIDGELRIGSGVGHKRSIWIEPSKMVLRNASVSAIQDADENSECWPRNLELEGFAYRRLGGLGATGQANMGRRPSKWFKGWLQRDETYSPQPYEQLAKVLREMGYPGKADDVLYAGRKRAHAKAREDSEWLRWLGMALLRWTIGFGLGRRYFRSLLWVSLFTAIGLFVYANALPESLLEVPHWLGTGRVDPAASASLAATKAGLTGLPLDPFELTWASFDQLLPIVTLDRSHEKLTTAEFLPSWALSYFYFQKLVGWVLGSFLIAGFAGLTQKN